MTARLTSDGISGTAVEIVLWLACRISFTPMNARMTRQTPAQVVEAVQQPGEQEVQRPQAQDGERVRGVDDERVVADSQHRGHAVHREHQVSGLNGHHHRQ